jgi:hypothetical protein
MEMIINKQLLLVETNEALRRLQEDCLAANQHDDITPVQELSAIMPAILTHAYSLRLISKGERREQLIGELAEFMKENALSENNTLTVEELTQALKILLKDL